MNHKTRNTIIAIIIFLIGVELFPGFSLLGIFNADLTTKILAVPINLIFALTLFYISYLMVKGKLF